MESHLTVTRLRAASTTSNQKGAPQAMTKTFDEIVNILDKDGAISDERAQALIDAHGPMTSDEKKQIAVMLRMKSALRPPEPAQGESEMVDEPAAVTLEDYIQALSVLDSSDASEHEKQEARRVKDAYESE
jgi:hypothetical protein